MPPPAGSRPRLRGHLRVVFDQARDQHVLLGPESVLLLNPTAAAALRLCDGRHTVPEIIADLRLRYHGVVEQEVEEFLGRMLAARRLELHHG